MRPLKIIFMGSPVFSIPILKALLGAGHHILSVYTQPARRTGRGQKNNFSPIFTFASQKGLALRTPNGSFDDNEIEFFKNLNADIAVVAAYGLILPKPIIDAPKLGCINVHASLLPRWRGAAPIQRAIAAGDEQTGICIMKMDETLDTGAVFHSVPIFIDPHATALSLHDQLSVLGGNIINNVLESLSDGTAEATPQSEEEITYAKKVTKNEGRINWSAPARRLERKIRALEPWPGARFKFKGEQIKIFGSEVFEIESSSSVPAGTVIDDFLTILCGDGALRPIHLQRPGRKRLDLNQFLMGYKISKGDLLS